MKQVVDPQDPPFDLDEALGFCMGNRPLLARQSRVFIQSLERELPALRHAFEQGDTVAARNRAHSLKGAAALLGASRVRRLAEAIELACRGGDPQGAHALLPDLVKEADSYKAAVAGFLDEEG